MSHKKNVKKINIITHRKKNEIPQEMRCSLFCLLCSEEMVFNTHCPCERSHYYNSSGSHHRRFNIGAKRKSIRPYIQPQMQQPNLNDTASLTSLFGFEPQKNILKVRMKEREKNFMQISQVLQELKCIKTRLTKNNKKTT